MIICFTCVIRLKVEALPVKKHVTSLDACFSKCIQGLQTPKPYYPKYHLSILTPLDDIQKKAKLYRQK